VLGTAAPSRVPLADLMAAGLGAPGRSVTAVLAVLLTTGTMNAYVAAATRLAGALAAEGSAPPVLVRPAAALALFAGSSAALLLLLGAGALDVEALVRASSAAFVAVYVAATAAGTRILDGAARACAAVAFAVVAVVLGFSGPYLLAPAAVAGLAVVVGRRRDRRSRLGCAPGEPAAGSSRGT
jgi:amino acid efflux transporter